MSDSTEEIRGYFDASGNPVVLTGWSAFVVEIGVLRQALSEKNEELKGLKELLTRAADALEAFKSYQWNLQPLIDELRKAAQ